MVMSLWSRFWAHPVQQYFENLAKISQADFGGIISLTGIVKKEKNKKQKQNIIAHRTAFTSRAG